MDNRKLQELMDQCYQAGLKHKRLLEQLEAEYEARFGSNPSDVDDDNFIDTFHYCTGERMTVKQMTKGAKLRNGTTVEEEDDL